MSDEERPEPKFHVFDRVYARDKDGLMYEAVVRKRLYGVQTQRQVQLGLISHEESQAADENTQDHTPTYFYYVHYLKWSPQFDSWVPEDDVYEPNEDIKRYAQKLSIEHKALRNAHSRKSKNKKAFQTIDTERFLRDWSDRMALINKQFSIESRLDKLRNRPVPDELEELDQIAAAVESKKKNREKITKQFLLSELDLRKEGLTTKRVDANKIPLPLGIKRVLVEQWEVITKCNNVGKLPANVTVKDVLHMYLKSKGVDPFGENTLGKTTLAQSTDVPMDIDQSDISQTEATADIDTDTQWIKMANGLAAFFDEALPERLLFKEEIPQLRTIDADPELGNKPYSEIYGPEYLLRLLVRLPDLMEGVLTDAECRPILGKINDLVRFCSKHEGEIFCLSYRPLNSREFSEKERLEATEKRKRKRIADCLENNHELDGQMVNEIVDSALNPSMPTSDRWPIRW